MESITVFWTDNSKKNLSAIYKYIANDSIFYADRFIERLILQSNKQLSTFPNSGRFVPEFENTTIHFLKELIISNYRIIYNIKNKENQVNVLAVINAKMDINKYRIKV